MNFNVRYAAKSDENECIKMMRDFYGSEAVDHAVPDEHFKRTFDLSIANSNYTRIAVCETDDGLVGYANYSFTYSNEAGGFEVLIEEVYVKPEMRTMGIGKRFFNFAEGFFDGKAKRYRLEVTERNVRAIKLYEQLGFKRLDYLQMIKDV